LDPDTLLDYNPQDGGLRIGVAGLAGLPLGDTALYSVRASIGESKFKWNTMPDWKKSVDGTYILENINTAFDYTHEEVNEKTFVLYTIDKYDLKTKETTENYAFAM
jgi:hypothetical protein